ncbi:hypothetical protein B0T22DRAFT_57504 [Podospora appendiculata]|uniref:Uncharacterized protein n=1 Tax=Podospora appendiculata TaxID=314037 RepID=A0AAE0XIR4_9PEZI|nr:hypothetical protein B0T22DRAFT_57504 [Podospora appendiculata]
MGREGKGREGVWEEKWRVMGIIAYSHTYLVIFVRLFVCLAFFFFFFLFGKYRPSRNIAYILPRHWDSFFLFFFFSFFLLFFPLPLCRWYYCRVGKREKKKRKRGNWLTVLSFRSRQFIQKLDRKRTHGHGHGHGYGPG